MGFRFRKSINLGGLRVNLSKSGVGYSIGGKGFRYTKKAGGGTRTTASIPGTGISHVTETGSGKKAKSPSTVYEGGENVKKNAPKNRGKWIPIVAVILAICGLASCFGGTDETATTPTDPTDALVESTPATDPTEETMPETEATDPPTEAPTDAPTEPPTDPPTEAPTDPPATEPEGITYILNTNSHKFHYQSCASVDDIKESNKDTFTGTREDVMEMGFEPCGRCHP